MQVTDEQVILLRTFLTGDSEAEHLAPRMATEERAGAFGALLYAAFSQAVRKRFSPTWTSRDVVDFVASIRLTFLKSDIDINPKEAETLIREALGEPATCEFNPTVFLVTLVKIIIDEALDDDRMTAFLTACRKLADARLARTDRN